MTQRVTLIEVAALAGVSYQTVSKVLNKKAQVSKETETRIMEAVHVLGYRPNQIARNMRTQRTHMIGYSWAPTSPDQVNPILDLFLQSMAQAAEQAGYHLLCFPHYSGEKMLAAYRDLIDTHRVDGFVISSVEYDDQRVALLQERNFPFVAFGRSNPELDFPYVDVDGSAGMYMATEHLLSLGHRHINALAWPSESRVGQNRMDGYLNALKAAGITPRKDWIARGEGNYAFGIKATRRWLEMPVEKRPSAIVAFNDAMAVGAMRAIQQSGLQVGLNIAVTGFDDAPMVQYLSPALTTIRQPIWDIGQRVMSTLLAILDGTQPDETQVLVVPQLIIRQSSAPMAGS